MRNDNKIKVIIRNDMCSVANGKERYKIKTLPQNRDGYTMYITRYTDTVLYRDTEYEFDAIDKEWKDRVFKIPGLQIDIAYWEDKEFNWIVTYENIQNEDGNEDKEDNIENSYYKAREKFDKATKELIEAVSEKTAKDIEKIFKNIEELKGDKK